MKKIYTKIKTEIDSGKEIEEHFFMYDGEIAECKGGVSVPAPPGPSEEELAIQREILKTMQAPPTEQELLMQEYTTKYLQGQIEGMPAEEEFREKSLELLTMQADYTKEQIQNLQAAKDLGEITGDLSDEEREKLDTLEANAIQQLTTQVNKQLEDVYGAEVASLVSKGVLQGAIGSETLSKLGGKATEIIARGTTDIESTRIGQELGMEESKRQFELQKRQLLQSGLITSSQAQQMQMGTYLQPQQFAQQTSQFGQALTQEWEQAKIGAGLQTWSQMAGERGGISQRSLSAAIASSQAAASTEASQYAAIGAIGGGIAIAV